MEVEKEIEKEKEKEMEMEKDKATDRKEMEEVEKEGEGKELEAKEKENEVKEKEEEKEEEEVREVIVPLVLKPRSLIVFKGESRYVWRSISLFPPSFLSSPPFSSFLLLLSFLHLCPYV